MTFSKYIKNSLKSQYTNDLVQKFYKPLLSEAQLYQRVSGYFNSAGLDLYIDGLEELAKSNGEVQFIISKQITKKDYLKIKEGYDLLDELKPLKLSERNEILNSKKQRQLGNLAFMIAMGRARVKVALTTKGIFHDKFGIVYSDNEYVFFNGSANETKNGISENYESISVDVSWDNSNNVQSRIRANINRFNRLWNNNEQNVTVIEASELTYEEIGKYQSLSTIPDSYVIEDNFDNTIIDEISFKLKGNRVIRFDNTINNFTNKDRKLKIGGDLTEYFEKDNKTIKSTTTYKDIERIIDVTKKRANRKNIKVNVSKAVYQFLNSNRYSIKQYKILGELCKGDVKEFPEDKKILFSQFEQIVQSEVSRPLKNLHLRAAYYEYEMSRAANFSVPGAGKTAMILGVFAYLNRKNTPNYEKIDRLLVISPISAFDSWKQEFKTVFGNKKQLISMDSQSSKDFHYQLNVDWKLSNLVLINYESLPSYTEQLKHIIDDKTMLIFDEVHRIKNPAGKRAEKALEIAAIPKFRYVLTGTPIPNTYKDIYNFLHILYGNEYNTFFGWDIGELVDPKIRKIEEINRLLHPFFWRTNKLDLNIPIANPDILKVIPPSNEQKDLVEAIYSKESSNLAILIRLIQASTNPSLVNKAIDYNELMSFDDEGNTRGGISEDKFEMLLDYNKNYELQMYSDFNVDDIVSPKFIQGINLVYKLVSKGKKVLVWGIFIDTLKKIAKALRKKGIQTNLVYGGTKKDIRVELINEFRNGDVQVLVSNPQTLGESISLHQTVHDAVYFEYNFNLTFMLQSRDRIHRLGLDHNQYTQYYYLQTKDEGLFSNRPGYIDQKIYSRLKEKEQVMYDAIDDDTLSIEYREDEVINAIKIIDEERKRIRNNGYIKN